MDYNVIIEEVSGKEIIACDACISEMPNGAFCVRVFSSDDENACEICAGNRTKKRAKHGTKKHK